MPYFVAAMNCLLAHMIKVNKHRQGILNGKNMQAGQAGMRWKQP